LWYTDGDYNGQIVELRRGADDEWELVRVREDRSREQFGFNNYKVAELTYVNYIDPFDFESLYAAGGSYFAGMAGDQYRAGNNYRRFVITQLISKWFSRAAWVIDMAAGRGADLHRFGEAGVRNILCMDIDATGIAELTRRKYEISEKLSRGRKIGGGVLEPSSRMMPFTSGGIDKMSVFTSVQDLTAPFDECVAAATRHGEVPGTIDAAACVFAFHYFCRDTDTILRVLTFVAHMLKPGGVFLFTTMDGDRIFKLFSGGSRSLRKGGGVMRWELKEPGQEALGAKYAIERRFDSNNLTAAGQTIAVKLPFSDEMRPEPLANIRHIIDAAKTAGMKLIEQGNFADYMDAAAGASFYDKLTEHDKKYIGLHTYVVLGKKQK
jgi:SAM-dependent methyltransferase